MKYIKGTYIIYLRDLKNIKPKKHNKILKHKINISK